MYTALANVIKDFFLKQGIHATQPLGWCSIIGKLQATAD